MSFELLDTRQQELTGRVIRAAEVELLASRLNGQIGWLLDLMRKHPLIGSEFTLTRQQDLSGLGVRLRWMTPKHMIEEAFDSFPGIAAFPLGFIPLGTCMVGSGNPYFVKAQAGTDTPLVRIPHDRLNPDLSLSESIVEIVRANLGDFFGVAAFE